MKLHRIVTFALPAMPSLVCRPLAWLLVLAAIARPVSDNASGAAYTFTKIAETDGIFAPSDNNISGLGDAALSLSNTGTVAFTTALKDGTRGVFAGNGGPILTIALASGPISVAFTARQSMPPAMLLFGG